MLNALTNPRATSSAERSPMFNWRGIQDSTQKSEWSERFRCIQVTERTRWNTMSVSLLHFASHNLLRKAVTSCYMQNINIYPHTWLCSSVFFRLQESLSHHETSLVIPFSVDTTGVSCAVFFAPIELAESPSLASLTSRISASDCLRCGRAFPAEEFALTVRRVVTDAIDSCRPWKSEGLRPWLGSDTEDLLRLLKGSNTVRDWLDNLAWTFTFAAQARIIIIFWLPKVSPHPIHQVAPFPSPEVHARRCVHRTNYES